MIHFTRPYTEHDANVIEYVDNSGSGVLQPELTKLGNSAAETIFRLFDDDADGMLAYHEVNRMYAALHPDEGSGRKSSYAFRTPREFWDTIREDDLGHGNCGSKGIGITLEGLKQAYTKGDSDIAHDIARLNLGSVSHFLGLKITGRIDPRASLGLRIADPMDAPFVGGLHKENTFEFAQRISGALLHLLREVHASVKYESLASFLRALLGSAIPCALTVQRIRAPSRNGWDGFSHILEPLRSKSTR